MEWFWISVALLVALCAAVIRLMVYQFDQAEQQEQYRVLFEEFRRVQDERDVVEGMLSLQGRDIE